MAELADALASGASGSNIVEVRVLLTAPYLKFNQFVNLPYGSLQTFLYGKNVQAIIDDLGRRNFGAVIQVSVNVGSR